MNRREYAEMWVRQYLAHGAAEAKVSDQLIGREAAVDVAERTGTHVLIDRESGVFAFSALTYDSDRYKPPRYTVLQ
jgi:hypothetical protein